MIARRREKEGRKFIIMKIPMALFLSCIGGAAFSVSAFTNALHSTPQHRRALNTRIAETKQDLEILAQELNPILGYFDPLHIADAKLWGTSDEFTIGFLRHAEIKHGRVAMAAFVGYCVQSNYHFPWAMTLDGTPFPSTSLSPPEQWDALPVEAKLQIILFIGFLEFYSELTPRPGSDVGLVHYTQGGVPGKYPSFQGLPHPALNLYDPFGLNKNMSVESKKKRLRAEINNGRLAMLGITGFLCAQTIPGSVPLLQGIVKPYSGEVMGPFLGNFDVPFL